ncbi:MAG: hypothetical protein JSS89_12175 [Bacteroidetes bacterium]|nr:hypothetical protein [Bacteroidota bacterium]
MSNTALRLIPTAALSEGSPTDYAAEVGKLVDAAQSPGAIAGGLALGGASGFAIYRLRNAKGTTKPTYALSVIGGVFTAVVSHALISWAMYRSSDKKNLSDMNAIDQYNQAQKRMNELNAEYERNMLEQAKASMHPVAIGVGVGTAAASIYGLYKWRNPKGSTKQRWVLPVIGGLFAGGAAQGIAGAVIAGSRSELPATATKNLSDMPMSDLFDFSSVTSGIVTAASIVCLYGGGRYLYDTWSRSRSKSANGSTKR